jgi:hypothetical protein
MAGSDRSDPVILGHVLAEHRELHSSMSEIRSLLAADGPPTEGRKAEVVEGLKSLREHLRSHFEQEERGGFLEESVTRMPRLSKAASAILAEHPRLLAELDGLIESTARERAVTALELCCREFNRFAGHVVAHERKENSIVQEGYNEDLGLVD